MNTNKIGKIQTRFPFLRGLDQTDRRSLAEKVMELGNIGVGALIFGQAISGSSFNLGLASVGIYLLFFAYIFAIILMRKKHDIPS